MENKKSTRKQSVKKQINKQVKKEEVYYLVTFYTKIGSAALWYRWRLFKWLRFNAKLLRHHSLQLKHLYISAVNEMSDHDKEHIKGICLSLFPDGDNFEFKKLTQEETNKLMENVRNR